MRVSGFENIAGPIGNLAGINMSGFDINKRPGALGGRSGAQLKGIYEGGTQQNQQLNEELKNRGIMDRGVKLPLVQGGPSPLGNAGFFEGQQFLAQSSPGGQNIGNVGGMLGEVPGNMTGFASLLESLQEQNMQNSQREKDRRSLEGYGRNLGNY